MNRSGVEPVVVDVFDGGALRDAVVRARPDIVIHQLTDLPQVLDPARRLVTLVRNSRLRIEGTANLVAAAQAAGCRRLIAGQGSIRSFAYWYRTVPSRMPKPMRSHPPMAMDRAPSARAGSARSNRPNRSNGPGLPEHRAA